MSTTGSFYALSSMAVAHVPALHAQLTRVGAPPAVMRGSAGRALVWLGDQLLAERAAVARSRAGADVRAASTWLAAMRRVVTAGPGNSSPSSPPAAAYRSR